MLSLLCLLVELILGFVIEILIWETGGLELASTITLVLQANRHGYGQQRKTDKSKLLRTALPSLKIKRILADCSDGYFLDLPTII